MNAFVGIRAKGGRNPTPQLFSLAFAVGVICFPVGVQPPQPPANFYPEFYHPRTVNVSVQFALTNDIHRPTCISTLCEADTFYVHDVCCIELRQRLRQSVLKFSRSTPENLRIL